MVHHPHLNSSYIKANRDRRLTLHPLPIPIPHPLRPPRFPNHIPHSLPRRFPLLPPPLPSAIRLRRPKPLHMVLLLPLPPHPPNHRPRPPHQVPLYRRMVPPRLEILFSTPRPHRSPPLLSRSQTRDRRDREYPLCVITQANQFFYPQPRKMEIGERGNEEDE
jgi:hypothetical protein